MEPFMLVMITEVTYQLLRQNFWLGN